MTRDVCPRDRPRTGLSAGLSAVPVVLLATGLMIGTSGGAQATPTPPTPAVDLGEAGDFAVLAGAGVTNVPTSDLTGDVGVGDLTGASITGLSCAEVSGSIVTVDATAPAGCGVVDPDRLTTARRDQTAAFGDAADRTPTETFSGADDQLSGLTLVSGVYALTSATTNNLVDELTLSGDADDVWIFQASSDLKIGPGSTVTLTGGAQACNVFWQVGSTATLQDGADFVGTILAGTSVVLGAQATIEGRALAGTENVTLIQNTITRSDCAAVPPVDEEPPVEDEDPTPPPVDPDAPTGNPDTDGDTGGDSGGGSGDSGGGSGGEVAGPTAGSGPTPTPAQVTRVPRGGVDTGLAQVGGDGPLLGLAAVLLLAGTGGAVALARRGRSSPRRLG